MNIIGLLLVLVALVAVLVVAMIRAIRADEYGHRPPPRSRFQEADSHWR